MRGTAPCLLGLLLPAVLAAACTTRQPADIREEERIGKVETREIPAPAPEKSAAPGPREALDQYEALLREETDPGKRAELAQRAAELRLQLAAEGADVSSHSTSAGGAARQSIDLLEASLSPAPRTPGNDQILYQLARAHDLAGEPAKSRQALSRLIDEHPESVLYAEALFRRAEQLFVAGEYRAAEADYLRLLGRYERSPFDAPARHKLAWAIFKQARYREALQKLLPLLDEQLTAERLSADGADLELQDMDAAARERLQDSVRVTVLCYALLGGAEHIPPSLRGHRQNYRGLLYLRLAGLYEERGHAEQAGRILQSYIREYPQDAAVTRARHRMIVLLDQGGNRQQALQARAQFVSAQAGSQDPETRELLASDLDYLTRYYHARAQATAPARNEDYRQALRWYRQLLALFPERHNQRYLMAELMLDHGDHLEAAGHFETLGYDTPGFARARDAAYAALLARRQARQGADEAAVRFTQQFPGDAESSNILAATAESRYAGGDYRQALATAERLLQGQLPLAQRLGMLSLVAHARFEQEDFAGSQQAAEQWLKLAGADHTDGAGLRSLLANSVYRQAQAARAAGDPAALPLLLRMRSLAPASLDDPAGKLRASASLQAAQLQLDAAQWTAAAATLEEMRRAFPRHPQQAEIARGLALAYEKQGRQQQAATEYERFSQTTTDPELRRAAAYQTAELHYQAGRLQAAAEAFRGYADTYKNPLDSNLQAQSRLVEIHGRLNDKRRSEWLKRIVETDAAAGAARSDLSRSLAADAALQLAGDAAASYRRTALGLPLDEGIPRKQAALEQALAAYGKAADYAVADVTTAASYHIAELYRDFAAALLKLRLPGDMADDERDQLQVLLEEQAFPLEEKAIQIHRTNAARLQQGLHDTWIGKSLQALMELVPGRYAKRERGESASVSPAGDDEQILLQRANAAHGDVEAWFMLGLHYARHDNPTRAEWALAHAATLAPGDIRILNELGIARRKLNRLEEAEQAYKRVLALTPDYAPAQRNLGILYDLHLDRPDLALAHYRRYAELQPDDEATKLWIAELEQRGDS